MVRGSRAVPVDTGEARRGVHPLRPHHALILVTLVALSAGLAIVLATAPPARADGATVFSGVIQESGGNPVPNLTVELDTTTGQFYTSETTGRDGSFSFTVEPAIYGMRISGVLAASSLWFTANVDLTSSLVNQTIALPPMIAFTVAVQDSSGNPVAGADVTCPAPNQINEVPLPAIFGGIAVPGTASGFETVPGGAVTNTSGEATLDFFPGTPESQFEVEVAPPTGSGLAFSFVPYSTTIASDTTVPVTLSAGSACSGIVQDATGNPVSGVCLSLALVGDTGRTGQAVNTRDDGSFSFRVEPGIYTMDVSATGAPPGATYQFDADVDLSSGLTGQTIMLPSPVALKFAVQDPWGQPVAGATVRFSGDDQVVFDATAVDQVLGGIALSGTAWGRECVSGTWTTDASGDATQLLFPGTPNGPFDIRVTPPAGSGLVTSFVSYDTPLTADTTIPVTLSAGSVFSGMVQDASGNPLPNVVVELGAQNGDIVSMQTGDDGAFSFSVEPGVYSLHLWSQQGSPSPLVGVDEQNSSWQFASSVDLTNSLTDQTITLPPVVTVKVRVHDSSGNPVTGATVDCAAWWESVAADQTFAGIAVPGTAQANEYFDLAAATDSSGSATMRVFPGTPLQPYFQVLVTPAAGTGMAPTIVPYDMPITGDTTIPVTVSSLSGTLETATGQPLPGQGVALQTDDSTAARTTTGSGGAFALTAPPATYSVALSGAIGDPTRYEVTVPGVDLTSGKTGTFKLPTHTLAIVVTGQAGKPLSHATVLCAKTATSFALFGGTARGSQSASAETNTAGKVSLQLLPARLLNLTVTLRTGHGRSSATKTVAASASAVCFRLAGLPRIGSSGKASAIVGRRLHFQVAASGSPAPIFSESGALPKGMKLSRTGLLHGTPSPHTSGTYRITVTAANRVGSAGQLFVLTVR